VSESLDVRGVCIFDVGMEYQKHLIFLSDIDII
jgi:hypothetical protein